MRLIVSFACAAVLALAGCAASQSRPEAAAPPAAMPATPPRLIVAIAVDQYSADLFAQYREHYTGGLKRLLQGAVFPSGFQSHAATETCPGHSTILTGVHPARTGIIANTWFDPAIARADKRIYCSEDTSDPASTSRDPVVSPVNLRVPTLGDLMKAADPATRNVAVSAKDRAVMMMGGHSTDAAYWYKNGQFVTLKGRALSPAAAAENATVAAALKTGAPALTPPAWCARYDRGVSAGPAGTIGQGRFVLEAGKSDSFRVSPRMDEATGALAMKLVDELDLGKGAAPDLLSVSFSATDYIGHAVGTAGIEMCLEQAGLDRAIGALLDHLDARGIDYMVVLTADHGGFDAPERLDQQAYPTAARVDRALSPTPLGKALAAKTGLTADPLLYGDGPFGDFWFNAALTPAQKAQATAALLGLVRAHSQVAAAWSHADLARLPAPGGNAQDWTLAERARASFDPQRSGDVVVLLNRGVVPIAAPGPGFTATHGSPWDYDRRVPMLFWRKGAPGFEQPAPVETVDIAPTLAALLGLRIRDGQFDGRCLDLDPGPGSTCPGP